MSHPDTSEAVSSPRLKFSLPRDPARLLPARNRIRDYLNHLLLDERSIDEIVLAIAEAVTNALRHGGGRAAIGVSISVSDGHLLACVRDDGCGFDPALFRPDESPDVFGLGGRGLFLIGRLMDSVEFCFDAGTEVRMRKSVRISPGPPPLAFAAAALPEMACEGLSDRLVEMLEGLDECFVALDWQWRYLYVNSAAERQLHHRRDELLGRSFFEVFPDLLGTGFEHHYRRAMEQGVAALFEEYVEPLGFWAELRVYPVQFGIATYFRDITERKRVELEHRDLLECAETERAQLEAVLVHLNEGIVILGGARLAAESLNMTVSAVCLYEDGCWRDLLSEGGEPLAHPSAEGESPFGELVRRAMAPVAACRVGVAAMGAHGEEPRRASLLGAPLAVGGCFRGAVIFTAAESREYSLAEMDFVRELGSVLGGALQNTQLYDALTSQLGISHLVLRASKILTEWTDLSLMLERLAELLLLLAPGSRASVLLLDFERQQLLLAASTGIAPLPRGARRLDEAPAALWKQVTAPRTVVFDYEEDPQERIIPAANGFRPRSALSVPMISGGNLIGLLLLETPGPPQGFVAAKIQALGAIADQAVTAIENARLFEAKIEAERRASGELEISQLMLTVAGVFASEPDLARLLDTVVQTMVRSFGQVRVRITLCGDRGQTRIVASAGEHADAVGTTFRIEEYSTHARRAMQTGRALAVDYDALSDAEAGASRRIGMRVGILAPLVVGGRAIGVLSIDEAYCRREFTARDVSLAQGIANQAAIAINNAVLLEKEREAVRFGEALDEAGRLLHSTLDGDTVLGRALQAGAQALGAASGVIGIAERSRWVVRYQYGFGVNIVGRAWADAAVPFMAEARRRRQPVTIGDTAGDGRDLAGTSTPPGVRSVLTLPLITAEEVVGALVYNKTEVEAFSEAEVTFATRLARSVSLALQNARLFASEHTIAEALQEALLAMPEGIPGCSIEHAYYSATVAARVGGDFYDVFELADGVIGVVIGDISGKGLDAAVLTSVVKNSIRAQALEQTKTPAEVLRVVNDVLLRSSAPEIFASVFFGVLYLDDGRLVYCNAGHTPGLVVRRDGVVDQLPHTSPVVGAFPDMPFACAETVLEADELLFLYTDGVIEARYAGVLFGEQRLLQLLADTGTREPAAAVRRVIDTVMAFTVGGLSDDMALLAVAPRGAGRMPEHQKLRL